MKEGRDLVSEAVKDAKSLRDASVAAAKNELIEALAPGVRALVEKNLKGAFGSTSRTIKEGTPDKKDAGFEEGKQRTGDPKMAGDTQTQELDNESLSNFFPAMSEEGNPDEKSGIPTLGEEGAPPFGSDDEMKQEGRGSEKENEPMDEEIEISEAELRKVYEQALQTEVTVKKSFADMSKSGELSEVDPNGGINGKEKTGTHWAEKGAQPPAKEDFTVKEMRQVIQKGLAENKALRKRLGEAAEMVKQLSGRLSEVNLFNSKVLHVNRVLNRMRLTNEQKRIVMESIDKARSIAEVKMVYETVVSSFNASAALHEGRNPRKPAANAQRAQGRGGSPDKKVLSESVDRTNNEGFSRLKKLAGLTK